MKISFNSAVPLTYTEVGYGNAATNMYQSLIALGHDVHLDDNSCPIQVHWKQPDLYKPTGKYDILYLPWESTELKTGWLETMNSESVKEIWTTSDWCKKIFINAQVEKEISVYPHGINKSWEPIKRISAKKGRPIKYLIIDAEANRKGWQEGFDAFNEVFGEDSSKATLTIKSRQRNMIRWKDEFGGTHSPNERKNVRITLGTLSEDEMIGLFYEHDVLIYPSWGEGFGFIPFQMLATGGIAITTAEWCHFDKYLGDFALQSQYWPSPWRGEHEGLMCKPNQEHLVELIRKSYVEFDSQIIDHKKRAQSLHKEYDWLSLTDSAFSDLERRL